MFLKCRFVKKYTPAGIMQRRLGDQTMRSSNGLDAAAVDSGSINVTLNDANTSLTAVGKNSTED